MSARGARFDSLGIMAPREPTELDSADLDRDGRRDRSVDSKIRSSRRWSNSRRRFPRRSPTMQRWSPRRDGAPRRTGQAADRVGAGARAGPSSPCCSKWSKRHPRRSRRVPRGARHRVVAVAPIAATRRLTPNAPSRRPSRCSKPNCERPPTAKSRTPALARARAPFAGGRGRARKDGAGVSRPLGADPRAPWRAARDGGGAPLDAARARNPTTLDALAQHLEAMASAWRGDRQLSAWLEVERAGVLEKLKRPDAARAALQGAMQLDGGLGPVRDAYTRHLVVHQNIALLVEAWSDEADARRGHTARGANPLRRGSPRGARASSSRRKPSTLPARGGAAKHRDRDPPRDPRRAVSTLRDRG